jgi:hypothetical protein
VRQSLAMLMWQGCLLGQRVRRERGQRNRAAHRQRSHVWQGVEGMDFGQANKAHALWVAQCAEGLHGSARQHVTGACVAVMVPAGCQ